MAGGCRNHSIRLWSLEILMMRCTPVQLLERNVCVRLILLIRDLESCYHDWFIADRPKLFATNIAISVLD